MRGRDKLFVPVLDKPLLMYCLEAFQTSPRVDRISLTTAVHSIGRVRDLVRDHGITKVVSVAAGGARRQDSVSNALPALDGCGIVLVHDGARPFVNHSTISSAVEAGMDSGAATAAVPVKDTIKIASPRMTVASTPSRETLWAAQTPQSFSSELLNLAHRQINHDVTDDAAMVEALGHEVKLFWGAHDNIKVTTPEDIVIAEAIAKYRLKNNSR